MHEINGACDERREVREFDKFFRIHVENVRQFVRANISDPTVVDEIVNDSFYLIWSRRAELQEPGLPILFTYARGRIRDHNKAIARRLRLQERIDQAPPTAHVDFLDRFVIQEAINSLSAAQRKIFHLYYSQGFTTRQIAQILGGSDASIRAALCRARAHLHRAITVGTEPATSANPTPAQRDHPLLPKSPLVHRE